MLLCTHGLWPESGGSTPGFGVLWTVVKKLLTVLYFLSKTLVLIPVLCEISTCIVSLLQPWSLVVMVSPTCAACLWVQDMEHSGAGGATGWVRRWTGTKRRVRHGGAVRAKDQTGLCDRKGVKMCMCA